MRELKSMEQEERERHQAEREAVQDAILAELQSIGRTVRAMAERFGVEVASDDQ